MKKAIATQIEWCKLEPGWEKAVFRHKLKKCASRTIRWVNQTIKDTASIFCSDADAPKKE